jgi:hypothetical protein
MECLFEFVSFPEDDGVALVGRCCGLRSGVPVGEFAALFPPTDRGPWPGMIEPYIEAAEEGGGVPIRLAITADVLAAGPDPEYISEPRLAPLP